MNRFFYPKLAFTNLNKNRQTYAPYIITSVCTVIMFYNICALTFHDATGDGSFNSMMNLGMWITAIFIAIFLFYTNSFLIKRRKKEFGLFNILGMEKKHIGKIMMWECIFTSGFSIIVGLIFGIVLNKVFVLLLYKLLKFTTNYDFQISTSGIFVTVCLFAAIFFLTFLCNLRHIHTSKPIELLRGGNVGEKEPKTKWVTAIIGVLTLGSGYAMALIIKSPLAAIQLFFVAVLLVIIGTYCLFTAGSIALLKMLRKNKKYYYQTRHFTAVSGMIYRMKQNAAGLANICVLSTAVLVMISTTISMYVGMEDMLATKYPSEFEFKLSYDYENIPNKDEIRQSIEDTIAKNGQETTEMKSFDCIPAAAERNENTIILTNDGTYTVESMAYFVSDKDYSTLSGNSVKLSNDEVLLYQKKDKIENTLNLCGKDYSVTQLEEFPKVDAFTYIVDMNYIVVSEDTMKNIVTENSLKINYNIGFDTNGTESEKLSLYNNLKPLTDTIIEHDYSCQLSSKCDSRAEFYILYGGLFFIGIFIGGLFAIATVLIIYYKQIIEGFDDKERFSIMQKVGMSHKEIKKSISSQVLTVFTLPIAMAIVHIIVAFPILTKLLAILNLTNIPLFIKCTVITVIVFIIIYAIVYAITSKAYYRIVNQ